MKLATFESPAHPQSAPRIGICDDGAVIDLTGGYARLLADGGIPNPRETAESLVPPDMLSFLRRGERGMAAARDVAASMGVDACGVEGEPIRFDTTDVVLQAPLSRPNSIRAFSVFEEHLRETFPRDIPKVWYEMPVYWKGNPDVVVGPDSQVEFPTSATEMDYEIEIGAVIGKRGRQIDASDAEEYISGYTVHNDWSARGTQRREMEMGLGPSRGKDFANGFGPYLVTPEEFTPVGCKYAVRINSDVRTERTIKEMEHDFGEMIEHISKVQPIRPGDVLVSGTLPGGCGLEHGELLEPGDTVELYVEGLGSLQNPVVRR